MHTTIHSCVDNMDVTPMALSTGVPEKKARFYIATAPALISQKTLQNFHKRFTCLYWDGRGGVHFPTNFKFKHIRPYAPDYLSTMTSKHCTKFIDSC